MRALILLALLYYFSVSDGKQSFRYDYIFHQVADGWLKLHKIPATWRDARRLCLREGGVLASPENDGLRIAMQKATVASQLPCGVFTGISSVYSKGNYYTIGGTPLERINVRWAPDEPDNYENSEECLLMLPNGTLADVNCSDVYPFICYKKRAENSFANVCGTDDPGYKIDGRTGSCYKFHTLPQTWPRAFAACAGEGGHLAVINSDLEAQVIKELYAKYPDNTMPGNFVKHVVHLGFSDWGERGLWLTVHGQLLKDAGFNKWSGGQPDNSTNQFCGAMFRNGLLDDVWCETPCPFICEKTPESLYNIN